MKHIIVLIVLFYIVTKSCAQMCKCEYDTNPIRPNKKREDCGANINNSMDKVVNITFDHNEIVSILNKYREEIRNSTLICNLANIQWSEELQNMAYGTIYDLTDDMYCRSTKSYGNVIKFSYNLNNGSIAKEFEDFTNSTSNDCAWIKSPYTKEIGCVAYQIKQTSTFACVLNRPILNLMNNSYGYGHDCDARPTIFTSNPKCNQQKFNCDKTDHFICWRQARTGIIELEYSTVLFLKQKLQNINISVLWDFDLQYLAKRRLQGNLTGQEHCLTKRFYDQIDFVIFGRDCPYSDQISKIECLLTDKNLSDRIGCAFCTGGKKVVLYCITANYNRRETILDLIFGIDACTEMDILMMYGLLLLTYSDIIAAIIFIYILRQYQQKQLIFSFGYSEPKM